MVGWGWDSSAQTRVDGFEDAVGDLACGELCLLLQTVSLCTGLFLLFPVRVVDVVERHLRFVGSD